MAINGIQIGIGNPNETFKTNPIKELSTNTWAKVAGHKLANVIMKPVKNEITYYNQKKQEKQEQAAADAAIEQRNEEWAREDEIRKETQEREDTSVQRYIEDAKRAGVNVAAMNVGQAASGGGITSATGSIDYSKWETEYKADLELLMQTIDQNFQGSENEKDRITDLIGKVISGAMIAGGLKSK